MQPQNHCLARSYELTHDDVDAKFKVPNVNFSASSVRFSVIYARRTVHTCREQTLRMVKLRSGRYIFRVRGPQPVLARLVRIFSVIIPEIERAR